MYAIFLSGARWAWLITLVDVVFSAVAILAARFPIDGTEQTVFIVHRTWYLVHRPMADLASGLASNTIAQELVIAPPVPIDLAYIVACVAQTSFLGFVFGILRGGVKHARTLTYRRLW